MKKNLFKIFIFLAGISHLPANASTVFIDKIYTPYVNPLEKDVEYRVVAFQDKSNKLDNGQQHKLSYGQAISERWFGEIYVTGSNSSKGSLSINSYDDPNGDSFDDDTNAATGGNDLDSLSAEGYELEFKWQATEQGEFAFDAGFLFEFEREQQAEIWEAATALLLSKEFGRVTFTTNIFLIYENGKYTPTEFESAANFQFIYRLSPTFEPAIEIYRAQNTLGIGPMMMGTARLQAGKKLHWEFGVIAGMIEDTPDASIKGLVEFEF